jgi:hypothetical protein
VSSILEALRELESERPRGATRERHVTVADAPGEPPVPRMNALIPLAGGLAVGIVAVGLYVWTAPGPHLAQPADPPAAMQTAPAAAATAPPAAPASSVEPARPNWLDRAEAPRARVSTGAAAPDVRDTSTAKRAEAPAAEAPAPAARSERGARAAGGQVQVESIRWMGDADRSTVTLRLHGRRVTLAQHEESAGVRVHLIMPDAVYLQRGGEVFLAAPAR